jgi:hypothetical protein
LTKQGIQARKDKKARKERLKAYKDRGELPPIEDILPIREPDKNPTPYERALYTEEAHPGLVQQIQELEQGLLQYQRGEDTDIVFKLGPSQVPDDIKGDYIQSSPLPLT